MGLAGAWVLFPLLLTLVATGWGLLVEQVAGSRLPGQLLPALGLAALGALLTLSSNIAPDLGLPIVVAGAAAGLGLCAVAVGPRPEGLVTLRPAAPLLLVAAGAFALYAAPVVLSGAPNVSGYLRLDDSATFLALGDWVFGHGRSTAGLPPSSYETSLTLYLASGYPVGSMLPLVAVGRLSDQELMYLWMPFMAVLASLLALAIELVIRPLAADARVRVVVSILASGSALLFAYMLWGGIKEVWTAALAASVAALVPGTVTALRSGSWVSLARGCVPLAVGSAGIVSGLSIAGLVWVAPAVIVIVAGVTLERGRGQRLPWVLLATLVAGLALLPLVRQVPFVRVLTQAPSSGPEWLGNLLEPLRIEQVLGIWPADDFRVDPVAGPPTALLLMLIVAGAAWALAQAVPRRAWGLLAYGGVLGSGAAVFLLSGWAWAEAKTLAIASPVPLALAGAAAGDLLARDARHRAAGAVLLAAIVIGVLWSDALGFRGTTITPHDRHAELIELNERFAGRGPALFTEYDPYATRWYLRDLDAEGAGALRRRTISLVDGSVVEKGETADIDRFSQEALMPYRLIVVRRSPLSSRPPSSFARVWRGHWYDVWERTPGREVLSRLPLGSDVDPGAVPSCRDVRRLARQAGPNGTLVAAVAQRPSVAGLDPAGAPPDWQVAAAGSLIPSGNGQGTARTTVQVPRAATYEVWLGGSVRGGAAISVDGREVGEMRHQIGYAGQSLRFGTVRLEPGAHEVRVRLSGGRLHPGTDGLDRFPIGPVALVATDQAQELFEVPAAQSSQLCKQRLDWLEVAG